MDDVKGDPIHSLPGCYSDRNRRVRTTFDRLEREFEEEVPEVVQRAIETRETNQEALAGILDEFTDQCVNQVISTISTLLKEFA